MTPDTDIGVVQFTRAAPTKGIKGQHKFNSTSSDDALDDSLALRDNQIDTTPHVTKYDIPIRVTSKTQNYKSVLPNCRTLKLWDVQNKHKFGFISLGSLKLPDQITPKDTNGSSIQLHKVIAASGNYNFLGEQMNVSN